MVKYDLLALTSNVQNSKIYPQNLHSSNKDYNTRRRKKKKTKEHIIEI